MTSVKKDHRPTLVTMFSRYHIYNILKTKHLVTVTQYSTLKLWYNFLLLDLYY